ncbi:MAG: hypothetical protein JNJ57_09805 [Saprospiraceae bacterium]|nr:hypothetical protein [Saprospiraceae bacterium]
MKNSLILTVIYSFFLLDLNAQPPSERNYSLSFGTLIYGDLSDEVEPFAGFDLAFDAKIKQIPKLGYLGASISYGVFDGLYGYYDSGKIFKIGPLLSIGKPKRSGVFALQYVHFKDVLLSPFAFRGMNLDAGLKLIGRYGGVFQLSTFYQLSFNKEPISQYVSDPHRLSNLGLRIAIGWAF